jgi:membrane-associated phospholipid phosphatase
VTETARTRAGAAAIALVCGLAYTALGLAVSQRPPGPFDRSAEPLAGWGVPVAWVFTASCLWPALVTAGVCALVLAWRSPAWRARALFSVVLTVVAWQTSDLLKNLFKRPRPPYWVFHHETTFSYSSGHALFATIVYGLWAYFIFRSALPAPLRWTLAALGVAWGLAVIWSRLALGAHYPTDLIGGVLLGATFLGVGFAALPHAFAPTSAAYSAANR